MPIAWLLLYAGAFWRTPKDVRYPTYNFVLNLEYIFRLLPFIVC